MDVWDPNEEIAENSQIKKPVEHPVSGFKAWSGIIGPGILTVFYFFLFFLVLSGCSYFKGVKGGGRIGYESKIIEGKEGNDDIIVNDLLPLEKSSGEVGEPIRAPNEIIKCIKLLPECNA